MARFFLIFIIILFLCVIQISSLSVFFAEQAVPDIILAIVILWTILYGFNEKWLRIMATGIILDLLTFSPLGLNTLSYVMVAFGVSFLAKRILSQDPAWKYFMIFVFVVLGTVASGIIMAVLGNLRNYLPEGAYFSGYIINLNDLALRSFLNAAFAILLYAPAIRLEKMLSNISSAGSLSRNVKF